MYKQWLLNLQILTVVPDDGLEIEAMEVKFLRKVRDHFIFPSVEDTSWCQPKDCRKIEIVMDNRLHFHIVNNVDCWLSSWQDVNRDVYLWN